VAGAAAGERGAERPGEVQRQLDELVGLPVPVGLPAIEQDAVESSADDAVGGSERRGEPVRADERIPVVEIGRGEEVLVVERRERAGLGGYRRKPTGDAYVRKPG
jgi:hypothetical protein